MSKKTKSLEELTNEAENSWGKQLPQFISLSDFETKIKRIARKYGNNTIHQEGTSHRDITIRGHRIGWSPRQKGHETVLASDTFKEAIKLTSRAIEIPSKQLEFYFKGRGKPYKSYKRKFEEKYL